jgi:hypothetical protein
MANGLEVGLPDDTPACDSKSISDQILLTLVYLLFASSSRTRTELSAAKERDAVGHW